MFTFKIILIVSITCGEESKMSCKYRRFSLLCSWRWYQNCHIVWYLAVYRMGPCHSKGLMVAYVTILISFDGGSAFYCLLLGVEAGSRSAASIALGVYSLLWGIVFPSERQTITQQRAAGGKTSGEPTGENTWQLCSPICHFRRRSERPGEASGPSAPTIYYQDWLKVTGAIFTQV